MITEHILFDDALREYKDRKRDGLSPSTWEAHDGQLERFRTWIHIEHHPNVLLADVDDADLTRYFRGLKPPAIAAASYNNYRQYIQAFYKFCLAEAWIARNPMRHVAAAKVPRKVRLMLSAAELLTALDDAAPRDRIALATGMNTALRAQDMAVLKVGDVNFSSGFIRTWIEKTDEEDYKPIGDEYKMELIRWLKHYAEQMGVDDWRRLPADWTLIPPIQSFSVNPNDPALGRTNRYKTDGTYAHPENIAHAALAKLGKDEKGAGFHTLRRSAARAFYELAKADGHPDPIRVAQAFLNHKNQATTEIYIGIQRDKMSRDDLLRGKSFLTRVAALDANVTGEDGVTEVMNNVRMAI